MNSANYCEECNCDPCECDDVYVYLHIDDALDVIEILEAAVAMVAPLDQSAIGDVVIRQWASGVLEIVNNLRDQLEEEGIS